MGAAKKSSGGRTLSLDKENRLQQATYQGQTTTFTYDGNGALVKKEVGGETTVYAGRHYELNVTAGQETKYYDFSGQRVAMRQDDVLYFVHSDHPSAALRAGLGSTSVLSNNSGNVVGDVMRYYPYGATRAGDVGSLPTDYLFTDQRREAPLAGVYHMGARFYDPATGRWLSADTIIPDEMDPQALNRFAYTLNDPLKYQDSSGHIVIPTAVTAFLATKGAQALGGALIGGGTYLVVGATLRGCPCTVASSPLNPVVHRCAPSWFNRLDADPSESAPCQPVGAFDPDTRCCFSKSKPIGHREPLTSLPTWGTIESSSPRCPRRDHVRP